MSDPLMISVLPIKYFSLVIPCLIAVAFLTLLERKVLSIIGVRLGPNKVSVLGLLQPIADAVKLSNKSTNIMSNFSFLFYYISSIFMFFMAILLFCTLFSFPTPVSLKYSVLIFFLVLGFNSLNSISAGWSSFSKFTLIGSIRTVSQLISYEAVLYLCLFFFTILICSFDFDSYNFNLLFLFLLCCLPCFYVWVPTFLAELNRTPYDFSEGESELVSGYNTEYGSLGFTLIFLAEYSNIIFFCLLSSFLFMFPIFLGFFIMVYSVIWFRSVLPRYRFDKLMYLSWKFFIPFLTFFYVSVIIFM